MNNAIDVVQWMQTWLVKNGVIADSSAVTYDTKLRDDLVMDDLSIVELESGLRGANFVLPSKSLSSCTIRDVANVQQQQRNASAIPPAHVGTNGGIEHRESEVRNDVPILLLCLDSLSLSP
jgi:hypothetical protein